MLSNNNDINTKVIIYYFNTFSILLTILSQWRFNVSDNIAYKLFQYNYILYTILIRYQFWVHKTLNSIYDFAISILYTFKQYWFNIVDMVWQNLIYQINYCMFTNVQLFWNDTDWLEITLWVLVWLSPYLDIPHKWVFRACGYKFYNFQHLNKKVLYKTPM